MPVELGSVAHIEAMWRPWHHHQLAVRYCGMCALAGAFKWNDSVGIAMDDERRYCDLREIIAKVGSAESFHAAERSFLV